jgi:hypothetical protein
MTDETNVFSTKFIKNLEDQRDIYFSIPKLAIRTFLGAASSGMMLWGLWNLAAIVKPGDETMGYWVAIVVGAVFALMNFIPALPAWRRRATGQPAISISKSGLTFCGQPQIPWSLISETNWNTVYAAGFLPVLSEIRVRVIANQSSVSEKASKNAAQGNVRPFDSSCLECNGETFLDYCKLYRAASAQETAC